MNALVSRKLVTLWNQRNPNYTTTECREMLREGELQWRNYFSKHPDHGISLSGYGWYRKRKGSFTRWVATDGSLVQARSVLDLVMDYGAPWELEYMVQESTDFNAERILTRRHDQEDYELGSLKGDHY